MRDVQVWGFGEWCVTVDGEPAGGLRSRAARELLLRMSMASGPVPREVLIDELWPDQADVRRGRRRLSQELNRVQLVVGAAVWLSTRDTVEVAPSCRLTSDLSDFCRGAEPGAIVDDDRLERGRLERVLELAQRGPLLSGHASCLADRWRSEIERDESRLIKRLLKLVPDADADEGLAWARRWSHLEPFDDDAHVAVVRRLRLAHGADAAEDYVRAVERRYLDDLGSPLADTVRQALAEPVGSVRHPLWIEIDRLRSRYERLGLGGDVELRRRLLVSIDERLRIAGHHGQRQPGLDELRDLGHDSADVCWREAEIAAVGRDIDRLVRIVDASGPLDPAVEAEARLILAGCQRDEMVGERERAITNVKELLADLDSGPVRIEADLLLARLLDVGHDLAAAERALLRACADAEDLELAQYRAQALCDLGWVRIGSADHARARHLLEQAKQQAERAGAESIEASAWGGMGHVLLREHRYGSALAAVLEASAISDRIADVRARTRWQTNAAVVAIAIGDTETAQAQYDAVFAACTDSPDTAPYWLGAVRCDLLEQQGQPEESLSELRRAAEQAQSAGTHGYEFLLWVEIARRLIDLERTAEAVVAASKVMTLVEERGLSEQWSATAHTSMGAALTAAGDPASGIVHLRKAAASSQTGLGYPHTLYYWHHTASTMLGEEDEARGVAVSAHQHAMTIRSDLTEEQWRLALANVTDLRRMAAIYNSSDSATV